MPSDESKGSQLDAIGSLAQRQLDNTFVSHNPRRLRHALELRRERLVVVGVEPVEVERLALFVVGGVDKEEGGGPIQSLDELQAVVAGHANPVTVFGDSVTPSP